MTRVRANYVFGETDALLGSGDTSLSSPALARLPVVTSPDVAAVTLHDPETGDFEIVHVTDHADSATTATILRAQEDTTAAEWPSGTAWLHGPTVADFGDYIAVVQHGADGTVARPEATVVYWLGTAEPQNALDPDLWSTEVDA